MVVKMTAAFGNMCLTEELMIKLIKSTLTVCSCHVTFEFKSESTLYSCLYVKELLIRNRDEI